LSGDGYSGSLANRIAKGGNAVVWPLLNFGQIEGSALSVADPRARVVVGETFLR
jgi:hypothetical protein